MPIDKLNVSRELKEVSDELRALKEEVAQIRADISTATELLRLIAANHISANIEREVSKSTSVADEVQISVQPSTQPSASHSDNVKFYVEVKPIEEKFSPSENTVIDIDAETVNSSSEEERNSYEYKIADEKEETYEEDYDEDDDDSEEEFAQVTAIVKNKTGMHARPAALFVQTASSFQSQIQLSAKGMTVDAKSILMLMTLGLTHETEVTITANGSDARDAVNALAKLIEEDRGNDIG